jgi:hypothetical protein
MERAFLNQSREKEGWLGPIYPNYGQMANATGRSPLHFRDTSLQCLPGSHLEPKYRAV